MLGVADHSRERERERERGRWREREVVILHIEHSIQYVKPLK